MATFDRYNYRYDEYGNRRSDEQLSELETLLQNTLLTTTKLICLRLVMVQAIISITFRMY